MQPIIGNTYTLTENRGEATPIRAYFETPRGRRIPATITRRWQWTLHAVAHQKGQDTVERVTLRLDGRWMSERGWVLHGLEGR